MSTPLPASATGCLPARGFPGQTGGQAASGTRAHRCRQKIEEFRFRANDETVQTTVSFGVADAAGLVSPADLIARADQALYEAKAAGRNTVRCSVAEPAGTLAE
jgi:diguanylate cyclase (GGDEF)-like protein